MSYEQFKSKDLHVYPTSTRDYRFDQVAQTITPFNIANIVKTSIDQNFSKSNAGCTVVAGDTTNKKLTINADTFVINGYRIELLSNIEIETTVLGDLYVGIVQKNITVGDGESSTRYVYSELEVLDEESEDYADSLVTGLGYIIGDEDDASGAFGLSNCLNLGTISKNSDTDRLEFTNANTLQSINYNRLFNVVIDDGEL